MRVGELEASLGSVSAIETKRKLRRTSEEEKMNALIEQRQEHWKTGPA